jgi:hypothetical protein
MLYFIYYSKFVAINYEFPSLLKSALFLDITQRRVVISYRRCGTTYRPHLQGLRNPRKELTLEDWKDRLSRNVGKELPL